MKKVFKIFLLSIFSLFIGSKAVLAATYPTFGAGANGTCGLGNPYYDTELWNQSSANYQLENYTQNIIYDLAAVTMTGDTLNIYGWVFNSLLDTYLGSDDPVRGAKVEFILHPTDGSGDVPMTVVYASESDLTGCNRWGCSPNEDEGARPKYYEFTYWNCYRNTNGTPANLMMADGSTQTYITGGTCFDTSSRNTDSTQNIRGTLSPTLKGGFKAYYDLSQLEAEKEYNVQMRFVHNNPRSTVSKEFRDVTSFTAVVSNGVKEYSGTNKDGVEFNIDVSGWRDTAKIVGATSRLNGSNGFYCSSVATGTKSKTYFQQNASYTVGENISPACRGGNATCSSSNASGYINLYELYVNPATGAPSSNKEYAAYAPASWVNFDGSITINTKSNETPEIPMPEVCESSGDIYYFYYFFSAAITNDLSGRTDNSGASSKFNDAEILKNVLNIESNSEVASAGGILPITKDNLQWYYEKLLEAQNDSNGKNYHQDGKNFYILHTEWCDKKTGECHPTVKFEDTIENYIKASIQLDMPSDGRPALTIDSTSSTSGLGFQFNITRYFEAHLNGRPSLANSAQKAIESKNGYLHPAVYQITLCPSETPQCDDTVESAVCSNNDQGTDVVFHESDDKKACTLVHGTHSGFTIIEKEDTMNFCTVACKDDLDIELPGSKQTAAGQYFLLDNYIPKITAKRTCVTSKIDYDEFDNALKEIESPMPIEYNDYQDYFNHYRHLTGSGSTPTIDKSKDVVYWETEATCKVPCDGEECLDPDFEATEESYTVQHYALGTTVTDGGTEKTYYKWPEECGDKEEGTSFETATGMTIEEYKNNVKVSDKSDIGEYTRSVTTCTDGDTKYYYTNEKWTIYSHTKSKDGTLNDSKNDFQERTGTWSVNVPCSEYGVDYEESLRQAQEDMRLNAEMHWNKYHEYFAKYEEIIYRYNSCFNWTDPTTNIIGKYGTFLVQGGESRYQKSPVNLYSEYKFGFRPEVSFNYNDRDRKSFNPLDDNTTYKYEYGTSDVIGDGDAYSTSPVTDTAYWAKGEEVDSMYTGGAKQMKTSVSQKGLNEITRPILDCNGTFCSMSTTVLNTEFYTSSYLSREEEITYEYHLPKLYTSVPDGRVTLAPTSYNTYLELDDEAVPVNINTLAGTYPYTLTIRNLKDDLRRGERIYQIASNNPDDDFEERFNEKALNDGENYVCNYDVINDIYIPDPERFNFFYRTIDDSNINPLGRVLGYNWSDEKGSRVKDKIEELSSDYSALTDGETTDRFVFTLTPTVMADIRKYNARQNRNDDGYADWDLVCEDYGSSGGYHCRSNFLNCLAGGYGESGSNIRESCSSIFETTFGTLGTDGYSDSDFIANRQKLISKQNSIDGRG